MPVRAVSSVASRSRETAKNWLNAARYCTSSGCSSSGASPGWFGIGAVMGWFAWLLRIGSPQDTQKCLTITWLYREAAEFANGLGGPWRKGAGGLP